LLSREFLVISFLLFLFVILIILLPYISQAYNFERLYQQSLFIISIFFVIGSMMFFNFLKIKKDLLIIMLLIFFLVNQGFFFFLVGGDSTINLYNSGRSFDAHYLHKSEFNSIFWLDINKDNSKLNLDFFSSLKVSSLTFKEYNLIEKAVPYSIEPTNYVYSSFTNSIDKKNYIDDRDNLAKGVLQLNFPIEFLNDNKNKIYNNGGSEIFK